LCWLCPTPLYKCENGHNVVGGLVLCCLMPLSTIFQLYRSSQFYWWWKPEYPEKITDLSTLCQEPSWLYGSWIYNYLCNQCLSPLKLWVRTPFMVSCTQYIITFGSDKWRTHFDMFNRLQTHLVIRDFKFVVNTFKCLLKLIYQGFW
jgi:hypothetical protein